jgi:hypothetical protein
MLDQDMGINELINHKVLVTTIEEALVKLRSLTLIEISSNDGEDV